MRSIYYFIMVAVVGLFGCNSQPTTGDQLVGVDLAQSNTRTPAHSSIRNEDDPLVRIGIDVFNPFPTKVAETHSFYVEDEEWHQHEVSLTVPDVGPDADCNIWVQMWNGTSGGSANCRNVQVFLNYTAVDCTIFQMQTTDGWWSEWVFDPTPFELDDEITMGSGLDYISLVPDQPMNYFNIASAGDSTWTELYMWHRIPVTTGDLISFSAELATVDPNYVSE